MNAMSQKLVPPPGMLEHLRKFDANAAWANAHLSDLLRHLGKFVAVDRGRIIGVADSEEKLRKELAKHADAYVTFVYPPDLAWVL